MARIKQLYGGAAVSVVYPKFHLARHVTSRHNSTRSTRRARQDERVEPCCSTSSTQPKCMGSTRRTCRVLSRRDVTSQVEFGLMLDLRARFRPTLLLPVRLLRHYRKWIHFPPCIFAHGYNKRLYRLQKI